MILLSGKILTLLPNDVVQFWDLVKVEEDVDLLQQQKVLDTSAY